MWYDISVILVKIYFEYFDKRYQDYRNIRNKYIISFCLKLSSNIVTEF